MINGKAAKVSVGKKKKLQRLLGICVGVFEVTYVLLEVTVGLIWVIALLRSPDSRTQIFFLALCLICIYHGHKLVHSHMLPNRASFWNLTFFKFSF